MFLVEEECVPLLCLVGAQIMVEFKVSHLLLDASSSYVVAIFLIMHIPLSRGPVLMVNPDGFRNWFQLDVFNRRL